MFYKEKARKPDPPAFSVINSHDFLLCAIHRAENTDSPERLLGILRGLGHSETLVVLPLHPRTKVKIIEFGIRVPENVLVIDPVGCLEMVWLEANCTLVVTDSGGVQKEAYLFGKPCVTLREQTEWVELVDTGWNKLVEADEADIRKSIADFSSVSFLDSKGSCLYGDGKANIRIVEKLAE